LRAVEDDPNLFKRNQASIHHGVQLGQNLLDAFGVFDHLDHNGKVLGEAENFLGVITAGRSIAAHAAQHCDAAEVFFAEKFHNGLIERLSLSFIAFANMNAHQGALALEFFMFHRCSSLGHQQTACEV
jgi:hypothetical protein